MFSKLGELSVYLALIFGAAACFGLALAIPSIVYH